MPPSQWQPFCLGLNSLNGVTSELKKIYYWHACLYVRAPTVTIWWLLSHKNKGICQVDPSRDGTGIFRENMLKTWALSQYKDRFPRYGDSYVKDKTVGGTVLSLTWEYFYCWDGIFILRRPPGSLRWQTMWYISVIHGVIGLVSISVVYQQFACLGWCEYSRAMVIMLKTVREWQLDVRCNIWPTSMKQIDFTGSHVRAFLQLSNETYILSPDIMFVKWIIYQLPFRNLIYKIPCLYCRWHPW